MTDKQKIITRYEYPPIPLRQFDWCAMRDGYEPGDPIGWGRTEIEAIIDLGIEEELNAESEPSK